jgi:phosphoribosylglycinamide formyltransferase 1
MSAGKAIAVLASGRGSNLQAILDATRSGKVAGRVVVVISDHSKAAALDKARAVGVPAVFVSARQAGSREAFCEEIARILDSHGVQVVCLAGFMRVLTPWFIDKYRGRMINVHPALLPSFPGMHAQKQALDWGVKVSGATVHFVEEGVDAGPIIMQSTVPVLDTDDEEMLSARILVEEHRVFVESLRLLCEDRLFIRDHRVYTV